MTVERVPQRQAGLVAPGTWHIDPSHTSIEFQVEQLMISKVKGRFRECAGTLEAGEEGTLTASGTIQTASIDTDKPKRDSHLRSADFFESETYPEVAFFSTSITPTGDTTIRVAGALTMHGITKPVELAGSLEGTGRDPWGGSDRVALELRGELDRRDFGLTWGGILVGDTIKVELGLSLLKAAASAPA
jgi:polyisoprenoid-binding protein YceI